MGLGDAVASTGSALDHALDMLREAATNKRDEPSSEAARAAYDAQLERTQHLVSVAAAEIKATQAMSDNVLEASDRAALARVTDPAFWADFESDSLANLDFLDNQIAALASQPEPLGLRYLGTDPAEFAAAFSRMRVVEGTSIPEGERGFLFSKLVYETQVKLRSVVALDTLMRLHREDDAQIATNPELQHVVEDGLGAVHELLVQLEPVKAQRLRSQMQAFLHVAENDLDKLLARFFAFDDSNLEARHRFFYGSLAPELELYRIRIGDTLALRVMTRAGYARTTAVKVYGTYVLEGLEKSPHAGVTSMMDLVTFRDLHGLSTEDERQELSNMHDAAGVRDLGRQEVEAALFGTVDPAAMDGVAAQAAIDTDLRELSGTRARLEAAQQRSYDRRELETGRVLHAAVLLKDEEAIDQTLVSIEQAANATGLPLRAVPWRAAVGLLGELVLLMGGGLILSAAIILLVALVVINNALVMATLERVREIGTLRALGAQRTVVLAMLIAESTAIALSSGAVGTLLGGAVVAVLQQVGVPAINDVMTFFFSGPRLYPELSPTHLLVAVPALLIVSVLSGIYPALLALRVSPREAMVLEE